MKFEQIDLDQNDWNYFFPVEICSMLANEENRYFIGGENDEGELTCVAAYIHNSQLPGELMLVYISESYFYSLIFQYFLNPIEY